MMRDAERLPWDDYFLIICDAVALRSIDQETHVGCVIVNAQRRVVSTGYNAFPAGVNDRFWPHDRQTTVQIPHVGVQRRVFSANTCPPLAAGERALEQGTHWQAEGKYYDVDKYAAMTHAEMNAIVAAGQDLHGCTLYSQLFPCRECAKAIITAGIRRVVYRQTREDPSWAVAKELFVQAGVAMSGPETPLGECAPHPGRRLVTIGEIADVQCCYQCGAVIAPAPREDTP
jgi:deoxycytidylate deaminase